jgi:four helix bundle protein
MISTIGCERVRELGVSELGAQISDAKFRDSIAWKKAMDLTRPVYELTSEFSKQEMFGLTSQLRRASVSIASNLSEGQGRLTVREFLHFLGLARGSALEVLTQLEIASMIGLGNPVQVQNAQGLAEEARRIINAAIVTTRANMRSDQLHNGAPHS